MDETAKLAVMLTLSGAGMFVRGIGRVAGGFGRVRKGIHESTAAVAHFIQIGRAAFQTTRRLVSGAVSAANALLAPNEQFEVASLQFEQLLGSAEAAKQRIKELYDYANNTPFLNPDVLQAGKILQSFGGEALGMGKGLKMTGDMAAYVSSEMADIAMWVGRAYSQIMSNQEFGDAAQRLQELTLLTGAERTRLEELKKSRATGNEIWAEFTKIMTKTEGSAKRLSDSYRGAKSTIAGFWGEIKRLTGVRLFEEMKNDIVGFRDDLSKAFETERIQEFTDQAGALIANLYKELKGKALGGFTVENLFDAAEQNKLIDLLQIIVTGAGANFGIALRRASIQHGPAIQRALIPERLHGLLGIGQNRQAALQRLASGAGTRDDLDSLGFWERARLTTQAGTMRGNLTQNLLAIAGGHAHRELNPANLPPYVDIAAGIRSLDLGKAKAEAAARAHLKEQADRQRFLASFQVLNSEMEKATTKAGELAANLELAANTAAVF